MGHLSSLSSKYLIDFCIVFFVQEIILKQWSDNGANMT